MPCFLHALLPAWTYIRALSSYRALSRRLLPTHILQGGAMRPAHITPGRDVPSQSTSGPTGPNSVISGPGVLGPGATRAFPLSRPRPSAPAVATLPIPPAGRHHRTTRAVIGDTIRIPILWCQFGSCIARYTHRDALGERDLRIRALMAGWRYDALGRLACPGCVQNDPSFWMTRPPVPAYRW
jgi:hypothetical protein